MGGIIEAIIFFCLVWFFSGFIFDYYDAEMDGKLIVSISTIGLIAYFALANQPKDKKTKK